jgi:hypothetical protein
MPLPKENLKHECFRQPPDPSIPVWRYIDFPKLIFMILRHQLALARLDALPDKFEGLHGRNYQAAVCETVKQSMAASAFVPGAGKSQEALAEEVSRNSAQWERNFRGISYISSWRMGPNESEAMWRLYGAMPASVALVLPYHRLRDSLNGENLYIGTVNYFDFERFFVGSSNALWPLISKRHEFEHENEVRIVKIDSSLLIGDANTPGPATIPVDRPLVSFLDWDPSAHIERIIVSPYAAEWQSETIREVVKRLSPSLADRVIDSEMGIDPP